MEKQLLNYRVIIERDERTGSHAQCYTAYVPTLGIATDGDTIEAALEMAQDAIKGYVASLREDGLDVPQDATDEYLVANTKVRG